MHTSFFGHRRSRVLRFPSRGLLLLVAALSLAAPATAQNTAAFQGTISDNTGGVLPGVTVTLASNALLGGQDVVVSGADGSYRLPNLPPGLYELRFELPGFQTVVREAQRLTVGFTAEIDVTMAVSALEETVTVTGESPVVDVEQTATSIALTREVLEAVPRGRGLMDAYIMTPGVITSGAPQVGDSNFAARKAIINYGVAAQPKLMVEGINITTGPDTNTGVYVSFLSYEELEVRASGNDAEVMTPGIAMTAVIKSGGNDFSGSGNFGFQRPGFQANNIDAELAAQGISDSAPLRRYEEYGFDLGGRVTRDRVWFYTGMDRQIRVDNRFGFAESTGPDGFYRTADDVQGDYNAELNTFTLKLTGQLSTASRVSALYQSGDKLQPQNGGGRLRPLEATRDYRDETKLWKVGYQNVPNSRVIFESNYGWGGYFANYDAGRSPEPARDTATKISRYDQATRLRTGPYERSDQRPRGRLQSDSSLTFLPPSAAGSHEMKLGVTFYWEKHSTGILDNPSGNYVLWYDGCDGPGILPDMSNCRPDEIEVWNNPVDPDNLSRTQSVYFKDSWRMSDRFTANLGVRWDRQRSLLQAQTYPGSPYYPEVFPRLEFPAQDINQWTRMVPRVGFAYDLSGDGQTVLKGTFGIFNYTIGESFAGAYNANSLSRARFAWNDLNRDNMFDPGEANLTHNPVTGAGTGATGAACTVSAVECERNADFITRTGASTNQVNPDLEQPKIYESTLALERELVPGLAARFQYVYKNFQGFFNNVRVDQFAAYERQIAVQDPGVDGLPGTADDGDTLRLWDYPAEARALTRQLRMNSTEADKFHTFEVTLTRRASSRWSAVGSFWYTWTDALLSRPPTNPNLRDLFNRNQTTSWNATASVVYNLPADTTASLSLQSRSGVYGQRTARFTRAHGLIGLSSIDVPVEPYGGVNGETRSQAMNVVSVRLSKAFNLGHGQAAVNFDVFNLFNSNAAVSRDYRSGATFYEVDEILAPRIARVSFDYRF